MPRGKKADKTYQVAGDQAVLGRAKGDQVTSADIGDPVQEERLVESGAITSVTEAAPAPETPSSPDAESAAGDKEKE